MWVSVRSCQHTSEATCVPYTALTDERHLPSAMNGSALPADCFGGS